MRRPQFCCVLKIQDGTLAKRLHDGEAVFAAGRLAPLQRGVYEPLDAWAVIFTSLLRGLGDIPQRDAAQITAQYWNEMLPALAQAEREMHAAFREQVFCVVGQTRRGKFVAAFGSLDAATDACLARGGYQPFWLPLQMAIGVLQTNAKQAGIALPEFLVPDPVKKEPAREVT